MKKVYLLLSIVLLIFGLLITIFFSIPAKLSVILIIFTFLPSLTLFVGYIVGERIKTKLIHIVIIAISIVSFLLLAIYALAFHALNSYSVEENDLSQCATILSNVKNYNPELVSFFPEDCSENVAERRFSYSPALMQGGEHIQLKVALSTEEINDLIDKYRNDSIATYKGGNKNTHSAVDPFIPTTFYYTNDTDENTFPFSFETFVLYAKSCETKDCGFEWNHGDTSGVAIDTQNNIVIYWAESW